MFKLICVLIFLPFWMVQAQMQAPDTLNFFVDANLRPMVGLSCANEKDCAARCGNLPSCQKSVQTCLSCIGTKSPYLSDFFNNVGELTTACRDQEFLSAQAKGLFDSVEMVPIFPISPYNPLGLKDVGLFLKFLSLCPAGTTEPVAIGFANSMSHAIVEIPLVKCGRSLYPLVRFGEDCAKKTDQIMAYLSKERERTSANQRAYQTVTSLGDLVPLEYDILQYSEFVEAQYVQCTEANSSVCQYICNSALSCAVPSVNERTAVGIAAFNNSPYKSCGTERFSVESLMTYLKGPDSFAFDWRSLSQSYDLPTAVGDFTDLTVINNILNQFAGVFSHLENFQDSSFFVSEAYRQKMAEKMIGFCDANSIPVVMGRGNQIERVFCRTGANGYFKILAKDNEACGDKIGRLSLSSSANLGGTK